MCGVAFIFDHGLGQLQTKALISSAMKKLLHRGPDDSGSVISDGFAIGHTRLSVVDLSGSQQPMRSSCGRYCLSFNGEIYNYKKLRAELEPNWQFSSQGDTEVLLAGLVLQGTSFLEKLKGMWAILFFDTHDKKLLLSRDRFGKKPLYYHSAGARFSVASEIPAIQTLIDADQLSENIAARVDLFRYGYCRPSQTHYNEIVDVLPGHKMTVDLGKNSHEIESEPYWSLTDRGFQGSESDAHERFRFLFKQAVYDRLEADVEVGAMLSGGIDSSLVSAVARKDFGQKLRTFSIGFESSSYDESQDAMYMADQLGVSNTRQMIETIDPNVIFSLIKDHSGQPFGDASILPCALVSKLASQHVKVCLTGDGADEVFCGYQRYQARILYSWYERIPKPLRLLLRRSIAQLPASHAHHSGSMLKKIQLFFELMGRYEEGGDYLVPRLLQLEDEQSLFPSFVDYQNYVPPAALDGYLDDVLRMMISDLSMYLPQDILFKTDRSSMAHSLELRSPFLDHELVEFALSLPLSWHRKNAVGKRIIRQSMAEYLPKRIWNKRKQGFSMPLGEWFLGALGDSLTDLLNHPTVEHELRQGVMVALSWHRDKRKDMSHFLWAALTYFYWRQMENKFG